MSRLNIDRQQQLEPARMKHAIEEITKLGYEITFQSSTELQFTFKDKVVRYFPYSGWHAGASINDGRGLKNLLKQII